MKVQRAIREERRDVYDIIVTKKEIQNDAIVEVETVERTVTIQELTDTINAQIVIKEEAQGQIDEAIETINTINAYKEANPE